MASNSAIIDRWVREVGKDDPKFLSTNGANLDIGHVSGVKHASIFSYGRHFEMARWVPESDHHDGYWLLNGDTYSPSTSRHQSDVRSAVQATGGRVLILPFRTLKSAGIDLTTIVPVEITSDRWEPVRYASKDDLREYYRDNLAFYVERGDVIDNGDGSYTMVEGRHVLGESLFRATYDYRVRVMADPAVEASNDPWLRATSRYGYETRTESALFLSAFDAQESHRHYFLAQLPDGAAPLTVEQAFADLRPAVVRDADAEGVQVTRQGDIFAVPVELTTREVRKLGEPVKVGHLLGQRHTATEVVTTADGRTLARGILRHTGGEHKRQRMGTGKTWHLIVKNTVPVDSNGQNRAWSVVGNVD